MEASIRPWFTTGVALVGASAIALTPITPMAPSSRAIDVAAVSAAVSREFQLTAVDIPYLLTLPIIRQYIVNEVQNIAVYLGGFAKSGVGLAQSLLSIPGVTVEVIQQVLALDFVGAFDTVASALRDSVIAVGQPLLDSLIWRGQKADLVQAALRAAVPAALIAVTNGFLAAGNGVVTSLIVGTQDLVAAILTLNLGNIVNAALEGATNFVVALGAGAGAIVGGIEAAQFGIATALATTPPPPPNFSVADVSGLRTLAVDDTITLDRSSGADTLDLTSEGEGSGLVETEQDSVAADPVVEDSEPVIEGEEPVVTDVVDTSVKAEPKLTPAATTPDKTVSVTPAKDDVKDVEKLKDPYKVTGVANGIGVDKPAATTDDNGSNAKPASGGEGE